MRYLLIDTPETVKPGVEVQKYGPEASKLMVNYYLMLKMLKLNLIFMKRKINIIEHLCYVYADWKKCSRRIITGWFS